MTRFAAFACGACGERVVLKTGAGRTHEVRRGVTLPVPKTFGIPTCTGCGEHYMSVERAERLTALLEPAVARWQSAHCTEVVERIQRAHGVTLREIERACGVTPTYLSHVLAGRKVASATLVFLLEAYALVPAEFERRRAGVPWTDALAKHARSSRRRNDAGSSSIDSLSGVSRTSKPSAARRSPH